VSRHAAAAPPTSSSTQTAAWRLVSAAAAHGLDDAPPIPAAPTDDLAWSRALKLAEEHRVLGLLAAAAADGALELEPAQVAPLADRHEAWCAHDLRLERILQRGSDALDSAGLPYRVIKGPALARRWYPDPAQRVFADLDLVVPSGRVREAARLLADLLGTSPPPELRPGFDERFGKETLLRSPPSASMPLGLELDIHRTPIAGAFGLAIPLDELFASAGEVLIGGRAVPTTGPVATFLLACYQATVADLPPRLIAARDVVQLRRRPGAPDADEVIAAAERWRCAALVAEAVIESPGRLGLRGDEIDDPLLEWARRRRPSTFDRVLLAAHRGPGYVYWRQLAGVLVLSGSRERGQYLRALLVPQRAYLRGRDWRAASHARRGWRTLTGPVRHRVVAGARRVGRRARRS
jgi:hypothetical protein